MSIKAKLIILNLSLMLAMRLWAHGGLETVLPANEAVLMSSPTSIQYKFNEPVKATRVKLARIDTPMPNTPAKDAKNSDEIDAPVQSIAQYLVTPGSDAVSLELAGQDDFAKHFLFAIDALQSGSYELTFRGIGEDGHPINKVTLFYIQ